MTIGLRRNTINITIIKKEIHNKGRDTIIEKKIDCMVAKMMGGRQGFSDPKKIALLRKMIHDVYYDLIKVKFPSGLVWHIPVPSFLLNQQRIDFYKNLPMSHQERDSEYFSCPVCNKPSFYDKPCMGDCHRKLPGWYRNEKKIEKRDKERFMTMIDYGKVPWSVTKAVYVRSARKRS